MTLDGKIAGPPAPASAPSSAAPSSAAPSSVAQAPAGGSTSYITGEAALRRVHQLRHASDAILVGVGTVLIDDPLLTDRSGLVRRRPLQRVVLDSRLSIPLNSRLVESAEDDVVVFCSFAEENKRRELEARGVRVLQMGLGPPGIEGMARAAELAANDGRPVLYRVLSTLGASQITSVLVEGGATINWACLRGRVVDKLVLFYTPKIFGPMGTVPWLAGMAPLPHDLALEPFGLKIKRYDEDFAVECYLRDPYRPLGPQG